MDGAGANGGPDVDGGGGPLVGNIHFDSYGANQEGNEENEEVAAATSVDVNTVVAEVNGDDAARALPRPQWLPTFVGVWMSNAAVSVVCLWPAGVGPTEM